MNPIIQNPFTWLYFPTALALGALHALEPGHAKTLTAAYLIGIKGTKRDALLLGLSVAFTHSIVVVGISLTALWLGRETFTQDVTHWLQIGSGVIVICLGLWMFVRRLSQMRRAHLHSHAGAEPTPVRTEQVQGFLEIIATPNGERFRLQTQRADPNLNFRVIINRPEGLEVLALTRQGDTSNYLSATAPNEPHEFSAELEISNGEGRNTFAFEMHEPHDHAHPGNQDHDHMSDDNHARAHAATMPEYAKRGERPSALQIMTFGAAGGMIPCPASITVMLLALSIGKLASGVLAVAGFSLGLAVTLVGIGLIVVAGISRLHGTGRFHWMSSKAPILSAAVVILSGCAALLFAH
jgi:nickel/cobalt transporter (NicO) family protein